MAFFSGDLQYQQQMVHPQQLSEAGTSGQISLAPKRKMEVTAFDHQFNEIENAIANYTKHQRFNHHYAPNVNVNRNHNHNSHHTNNNRHHNNGNNHRFQQQQHGQSNFAMNAKLKQQQQQQFLLAQSNPQQIARLKQFSNGVLNSQQQQAIIQPQRPVSSVISPQMAQIPQVSQVSQVSQATQPHVHIPQQQFTDGAFHQQLPQSLTGGFNEVSDLSYDSYPQAQSRLNHPDLLSTLRSQPQGLGSGVPVRPGSVGAFGAPLEQISSGTSSFGLSNSDLMTAPLTPSSSIALEDSTGSYLGDIWGNTKYNKGSSTSVWA